MLIANEDAVAGLMGRKGMCECGDCSGSGGCWAGDSGVRMMPEGGRCVAGWVGASVAGRGEDRRESL